MQSTAAFSLMLLVSVAATRKKTAVQPVIATDFFGDRGYTGTVTVGQGGGHGCLSGSCDTAEFYG